MHTIQYTAKNEEEGIIRGLIEAGTFASEDEVITAALRLLAGQENKKLERLRRLLIEGIESGTPEPVDRNELLKELRAQS